MHQLYANVKSGSRGTGWLTIKLLRGFRRCGEDSQPSSWTTTSSCMQNTMMVFGDAKKTVEQIIQAL